MKQGKSLSELASEVDRQAKAIQDYRSDTRQLGIDIGTDSVPHLILKGKDQDQEFSINDLAHSQIAGRLDIPQKYYDYMRVKAPGLLKDNVNYWFTRKPETRLVRTLDNRVRAFLSSSYRPLDNYKLVETVLPKLQKLNATIESSEITERRIYIKAVFNEIGGQVAVGDVVKMGLIVSNSEVGCGSLKIEPLIYNLRCLNGMIVADSGVRKYHIGRRNDEDTAEEFYRDQTRIADDRAFWMKVKDIVDATVTQKGFDDILSNLKRAKTQIIDVEPLKAVEAVVNKYRFTEVEQSSVLTHLIKGGDLSTYGMAQAVTRTSQDIADYDRATEFERFGGEIIASSLN